MRLTKPSQWWGDSWSRHRIVVLGAVAVAVLSAVSLVVWSESQAFALSDAQSVGATAENVIAPVAAPSAETGIKPAAVPPIEVVRASDPMDASAPVRLTVDSIGVDTPLMDLGLQSDGTLEVPPDGTLAGWFTGAPTPGELGPAVIAGHVDWVDGPAVFYDLHRMVTGDLINVERADGSTAVFAVSNVGQYPKNQFPTDAVYGPVSFAGLRLITCGGVFNDAIGHYDDNIVVFAELVSSTPATSG